MSATPDVTDHAAVFAALLKPIAPAEPLRVSVAAQLTPWAPHFLDARKAGYSWGQLAEIAARPEIGITLPPERLRRLVSEAVHGSSGAAPTRRRRLRQKTTAAVPVVGAPASAR